MKITIRALPMFLLLCTGIIYFIFVVCIPVKNIAADISSPLIVYADAGKDNYASFNNIITNIGSTQTDIYLARGTYKISKNITFSRNTTLHFAKGAILSLDSGVTITINGEIKAELQQIFAGSGNVSFGMPMDVYINWFGANLDGVTDDTAILNKANTSAFYGSTIIVPYTPDGIYITDVIYMKSGINWNFNNSSMYIKSCPKAQDIFYTGSMGQDSLVDVSIKNLKAYSTNDQNYWNGGSTPNTSNIYFFESNNGVKNLTIKDIYIENVLFGVKLDRNCNNVELNNIEIIGSSTPIYMSGVTRLRGNNWRLSITSVARNGDHQIYFNSGMQDIYVTNVELIGNGGLEGACIVIQNSNQLDLANRDIYFDVVKMTNVNKGIEVTVGDCININFNNVYGSGLRNGHYWLTLGWAIAAKKVIDGVTIRNFFFEDTGGGLVIAAMNAYNVYPTNVRFVNGTVKGRSGFNMIYPGGIKGLYLEDVVFTEGQSTNADAKLIVSPSNGYDFICMLNNCKVYYNIAPPSTPPIAIENIGNCSLVVKNSYFINNSTNYSVGINWNTCTNKIFFQNNEYKGFTNLRTDSDTSTITKDNFNLTTLLSEYTVTTQWNPKSLADGAGETSASIAVPGAAFGDYVIVSAPYDLKGITCCSYVSAANIVKIRLQNETGATVDLASGTWKVKVIKS